ncbi:MAG: helix-turn-helix domain-containing protein [Pseudodesulfovibrio sp.]|nr:helix-turn-helix domain-containing protein [Pseudodesulfovibrio sp.]
MRKGEDTLNEAALLNQEQTAQFLNISPRTLEKWRWEGTGPRFCKIGRRAMYRPVDLQSYVDSQIRKSTSDPGPVSQAA